MATPIIPRVIRDRLYFQTADVSFPAFAPAAGTWDVADTCQVDMTEPLDHQQTRPPLRRCDDCQLHLGRNVLRALGSCPRWGERRHGVESHCPAFVAKDGAR